MLISVITPCYNAERYIAETISSVMTNSVFIDGSAKLEYLICDGGSTDKTVEIVNRIVETNQNENIRISLLSEKDDGMYDALAKGLRKVTGDVTAYINAGDFYSPGAFEVVIELLRNADVNWLTGLQVRYNEKSHMLAANLPFKYRRTFCQRGLYGTTLPFIQQESTFWASSLNRLIDLERLSEFRLAGDYFIWQSFAREHQLFIVEAWLGGFRVHESQLSDNIEGYRAEVASVAIRPSLADHLLAGLDTLVWHSPNRIKRFFNRQTLFSFSFKSQAYERNVSGF